MTTTARTIVAFTVPGKAITEGNVAWGNGHSYHREGKALDDWRYAIQVACREHFQGPVWTGPVELRLFFAHKARRKADSDKWRTTRPDADKLARAVLDALTGILYKDDSQVARLDIHKEYGSWAPKAEGGPEEPYLTVNARVLS